MSGNQSFLLSSAMKLRLLTTTVPNNLQIDSDEKLLFHNVFHSFTYSSYFFNEESSFSQSNHTYAKLIAVDKKKHDIVVKVLFIDQLSSKNTFRLCLPMTNPPSIYLHPNLIEKESLEIKSLVWLEKSDENSFKMEQSTTTLQIYSEIPALGQCELSPLV